MSLREGEGQDVPQPSHLEALIQEDQRLDDLHVGVDEDEQGAGADQASPTCGSVSSVGAMVCSTPSARETMAMSPPIGTGAADGYRRLPMAEIGDTEQPRSPERSTSRVAVVVHPATELEASASAGRRRLGGWRTVACVTLGLTCVGLAVAVRLGYCDALLPPLSEGLRVVVKAATTKIEALEGDLSSASLSPSSVRNMSLSDNSSDNGSSSGDEADEEGCDSNCLETRRSFDDLRAYWDVEKCGPKGDDHNSEWCGGQNDTAPCAEHVNVNETVCVSGVAELEMLNVSTTMLFGLVRNLIWIDNCSYVYHAQYKCIPTTTTTTTTTSSTTVTTTSTTVTTTSTTITTTTTTTTTVETEEMFAHRMKSRWPEPEDFKCDNDCPGCWKTFEAPKPKQWATEHNGLRLKDVCIEKKGLHRAFVIGDWGGVIGKHGLRPADHRDPKKFKFTRKFIAGVDDSAQYRVAAAMQTRALSARPDYVLNVGDNFYWGGIEQKCGEPAWKDIYSKQFDRIFEQVYHGEGIDGIKWLGVLGNHDYGGYTFTGGWDQAITYTWGKGGRWMTPAQYWRVRVHYPGFSLDYFFLDTNKFDAAPPMADPGHNLCNNIHNDEHSGCGPEGPTDMYDCSKWFAKLWDEQSKWLEKGLNESDTDWQIVVTHFPPTHDVVYWQDMVVRHGIDLIVTGHQHLQEMHHFEDTNWLRPSAWIVTGGGGGITSEDVPDPGGHDNMYGFFELTFTKGEIAIKGVSHGGIQIYESYLIPRPRNIPAPPSTTPPPPPPTTAPASTTAKPEPKTA